MKCFYNGENCVKGSVATEQSWSPIIYETKTSTLQWNVVYWNNMFINKTTYLIVQVLSPYQCVASREEDAQPEGNSSRCWSLWGWTQTDASYGIGMYNDAPMYNSHLQPFQRIAVFLSTTHYKWNVNNHFMKIIMELLCAGSTLMYPINSIN